MTRTRKTCLAVRLVLFGLGAATTPAAASTFDGGWSVSIVTRSGGEGGTSLPLRIAIGRVEYGTSGVSASGRVGDDGRIVVR
jgi:hypothetical protein